MSYRGPSVGSLANDAYAIEIWRDPDAGKRSGTWKAQQGRIKDGWRP